jgi:hypothetical protein
MRPRKADFDEFRIEYLGEFKTIYQPDFGDFRFDFLGEYDAKCETDLGRESGP